MSKDSPGRLLVALPYLPLDAKDPAARAAKRLSAASSGWSLDFIAAGPAPSAFKRLGLETGARGAHVAPSAESFVATLQNACAARHYDGVLLLDHPICRQIVDRVNAFTQRPTVLINFPGVDDSHALEVLEVPAIPYCHPSHFWSIGPSPFKHPDYACLPERYAHTETLTPRWFAANARFAETPRRTLAPTSIVIPCWNNLGYTRRCLESVLKHAGEAPFDVIIVDNGSTDGTSEYVKSIKDPRVRLIRNDRNLGFARAINQGTAAATGIYVLWLNNDAVVTPGWLDRLVACADRAPWIGAVGPYSNEANGPQRWSEPGYRGVRDLPAWASQFAVENAGKAKLVARLVGFCFLVRREVVAAVGTLDERFGSGCYEDFDYCLRLRQAGYELVLAEDVFVHHFGHKSFGSPSQHLRHAQGNRDVFIKKWCRQALELLDELDPALSR